MKEQTVIIQKGGSLSRIVGLLSALVKDRPLKVVISEHKRTRSLEQNNALFGVAYKALSDYTGYTAPELHDAFLRAYFGEVEKEVFGKRIVKPRRTTTTNEHGSRSLLTTTEFRDFYAFVQQKGAEIGCWVPDPDPMYWMREVA